MTALNAALRRLFFLFRGGLLTADALGPLVAAMVVRHLLKTRLNSISNSIEEYETNISYKAFTLPEDSESEARSMVETMIGYLPSVELLSDDEKAVIGNAFVDASLSVPDEALAGEEDWIQLLNQTLLDKLEAERREHEEWFGLDTEDDRLADLEEAADFAEELRTVEAELDQSEREKPLVRDESDQIELDSDYLDKQMQAAVKRIEAIMRERSLEEGQKARLDAVEEVLEKGSPVLPDNVEVEAVWETDGDPCPECAALAGTPVEKRRRKVGHHPNCACSPEIAIKEQKPANGPGFLGLSVAQLRHHLRTIEPLKESAWRTKQMANIRNRIEELENA